MFKYCTFAKSAIRKIKKYVVQHIKKFGHIKKKQYLCSVKRKVIYILIITILTIFIVFQVLRLLAMLYCFHQAIHV